VARALFLLVSRSELSESANESAPHVMINRGADSGNAMAPGVPVERMPAVWLRQRGNQAGPPWSGQCGWLVRSGARSWNSVLVMCVSIIRWVSSANFSTSLRARLRALRASAIAAPEVWWVEQANEEAVGVRGGEGRAAGGGSFSGQDRRHVQLR
jgi:anti-sigma factor RsiW